MGDVAEMGAAAGMARRTDAGVVRAAAADPGGLGGCGAAGGELLRGAAGRPAPRRVALAGVGAARRAE